MELNIDINNLAIGTFFNVYNGKYDIIGLICKYIGIPDDALVYSSIVISDEIEFPDILNSFFVKLDGYSISIPNGYSKYDLNEFGSEVSNLSDIIYKFSSNEIYKKSFDELKEDLSILLLKVGIDICWE